ncbi:MAG: hypothetical protein IPP63_12520 [Chloracidobacterium sp.]|nr:hypothetical protein [Chloracidobacterium sp.]
MPTNVSTAAFENQSPPVRAKGERANILTETATMRSNKPALNRIESGARSSISSSSLSAVSGSAYSCSALMSIRFTSENPVWDGITAGFEISVSSTAASAVGGGMTVSIRGNLFVSSLASIRSGVTIAGLGRTAVWTDIGGLTG